MNLRTKDELYEISRSMLLRSYSPYSKFKVGAALSTFTGKVFAGCNIENVSYGLSICAERVALFKAVSEGHTKFHAIAISSSGSKPVFPCGACLQFLAEFSPRLFVYVDKDHKSSYKLPELIPHAFDIPK
jgi:cytidine deaminase